MAMAIVLLGCGLFSDRQKAVEGEGAPPPVMSETPQALVAAVPAVAGREDGAPSSVSAPSQDSVATHSIAYNGPSSLEERILNSPVIVWVRLDSASSSVEYGNTVYGARYIPTLEFNFSVLEYLKGSGSNDIEAVWDAAPEFDTRQEAEATLPSIAGVRDTRWDDREAIVFLQYSQVYLPSTQQADRYYLSWERSYESSDDGYSVASRYDKLWLPANMSVGTAGQAGGDQQRFLLDVPSPPGVAPTVTLGEMKARIAEVEAKLAAGDGSAEYRECVELTYQYEGMKRYRIAQGEEGLYGRISNQELVSGLASSTLVYEYTEVGGFPDNRPRVWFDGLDSDLFGFEYGEPVPWDSTGDSVNDIIEMIARVVTTRPLPAGGYSVNYNNLQHYLVLCDGYTIRYEWTVTVNAPEGTLHEAFFDPVTDGSTVAADSANGVLMPVSFAGANGATTTIERIVWEPGAGSPGTVKVRLTPHTGIAGHFVDFIALDGSVSLSLHVADATVDAANSTLSWPVASQPWRSGEKLMLRIREAPG